jgi:hypothetical protein
MSKAKRFWCNCILILLLFNGGCLIHFARSTGWWYIWFWQQMADIEFDMVMDDSSYENLTFINIGADAVHNIYITVREDFSYIEDGGFTSRTVHFDTIGSNQVQVVPMNYANDGVELGRLEVWIKCDRGKAYMSACWSYANYIIEVNRW